MAPRVAAPAEPSWHAALQNLLHELPGLVSDRVELLSLELHRAGLALAQMVALVVAAAIVGATAWLALWGCAVGALVAAGLHWAVALLVVLLLNAAACVWAVLRVRTLAPLLKLPATRRHLTLRVVPEVPQTPQAEPPVRAAPAASLLSSTPSSTPFTELAHRAAIHR